MKKDLLAFLSIKLIPAAINFALIPILYDQFGVALYGELSLVLSLCMLIVTVFTGFFVHSIYRYFTSGDVNQYFSLILFLSIFSFLISLIVFFIIDKQMLLIHFISGLLIVFASFYTLILIVFQLLVGKSKLAQVESIRVFTLLGLLISLTVVKSDVILQYSLELIIAAYAISYLFSLIFVLCKLSSLRFAYFEFKWVLKHIQFGAKIALWLVVVSLFWYMGKVFIEENYSAVEFGRFAAIFDLIYKVISLFGAAFTMYLYPVISKLIDEQNSKQILPLVFQAVNNFMLLSLFVIFLSYFIGPFVLEISLKESFSFNDIIFVLIPLLLLQGAIVLQKPVEVSGEMGYLVSAIFISTIITYVSLRFFVTHNWETLQLFGFSFFLGTFFYFLFVMIFVLKKVVGLDKVIHAKKY